jgi:signal transduction histidine kinase
VVRCIAITYSGVQVGIWHVFYLADPWRLAGPAAALAWAAVVVVYLFTRRPQWQFAVVDSLVYVVLVLGAGWSVPPAMRGDTANWLFIMMAGQLLVAVWFVRLPLSALLALVAGIAYWTGSLMYPEAGPGGSAPASAGAALLAVAIAVWCGRWAVQRWAARADDALARADADTRVQYVELSRNIERREHERLLHDTVLNTLTALARGGGDPRATVGRCQHDVRLMEYVLSHPAESGPPDNAPGSSPPGGLPHGSSPPGSSPPGSSPPGSSPPGSLPPGSLPHGGLLAGLEAVAAEMRARGLAVHVAVTGTPDGINYGPGGRGGAGGLGGLGEPGGRGGSGGLVGSGGLGDLGPLGDPEGNLDIPARVVIAMTHAVREALSNVAAHAGTGQAWVELSLAAAAVAGPGAGGPGGNGGGMSGSGGNGASGRRGGANGGRGGVSGGVRVTVLDAGRGFDPDHSSSARLGLRRSIFERMADQGGSAVVRSAPGQGTEVILRWPAAAQTDGRAPGPPAGRQEPPW